MTHIGLDRTEQCGLICGTAPTHHAPERVGFDRVAQNRSGAVRLDVIDVARVDPGIAIGPAQHIGLGIGVGCQHAVGSAVMVDRAARDDGENIVAVPTRVVESLEHQHARAL